MFMGVAAMFMTGPNWRFAQEATPAEAEEALRIFGRPRDVAVPAQLVILPGPDPTGLLDDVYLGHEVGSGYGVRARSLAELARKTEPSYGVRWRKLEGPPKDAVEEVKVVYEGGVPFPETNLVAGHHLLPGVVRGAFLRLGEERFQDVVEVVAVGPGAHAKWNPSHMGVVFRTESRVRVWVAVSTLMPCGSRVPAAPHWDGKGYAVVERPADWPQEPKGADR